jgi:hypothetical protein
MKKKLVKDFFDIFIKNYLVGDILILDNIKKDKDIELGACTIPQAMTVISGIDLLGLLFGNNKETNDSEKHIFEFYRITKQAYKNDQYSVENIEKIISYRHGMMHSFFPKFKSENIGICKSELQELIIKQFFDDIEIESINVTILTRDFLLAVSLLEIMLAESSEDLFFDNILNSIKDLGYSNHLAITTSTITTMNIVTKNTRK